MSIFSKNNKPAATGLVGFANQLQADAERGLLKGGMTARDVKGFIGIETFGADTEQNLAVGVEGGWQHAAAAASATGNESFFESLTDAQIEAGKIIIAASANPSEYARRALTHRASGVEGMALIDLGADSGAGFDFRDEIHTGLESFDNTALNQFIGYSIAFNVQAARQDDYSEAFYPTTVVTPDQGGIDITARLQQVFNEVRHSITGKPTDFNQKNLLEAVTDYTILAADSLKVVPYYVAGGGGSSANFVNVAKVPATNATVEGVTFSTAALAIDTKINLLGVAQHPGLAATGVLDNTDSLDGKIILQNLYIAFQSGTGAEEVVKFDTSRLLYSHFNKTAEGRDRKLGLQFQGTDLVLDINTQDIAGGNLDVFDAFQTLNYTVRLQVNVYGFADAEYGTIELNANTPSVALVLDSTGNIVDQAATGVPAAIAGLGVIKVLGFDLDARRTNSNRRTRGLLCNSQSITERYQIPIGSPISIPTPINSDSEAGDINTLVTAARIRNSNMAVTALLNYAATLKQFASVTVPGVTPNIAGIGRYYVTPYYAEELAIDFTTLINSIQSHQRIADVRGAFIALIRQHAYKMLQASRYKVALDQMTGFTGKRPTLLVGTDQVLAQYIMVDGDSRTIGPDIDYKVVVSNDKRLYGTVFLTFVRDDETGPSPLNFGVHAWVPELTSAVQVQRNGAYTKEVMVQPRNVHINTLPVLTKLTVNVQKLEDAISDKTKAPAILV